MEVKLQAILAQLNINEYITLKFGSTSTNSVGNTSPNCLIAAIEVAGIKAKETAASLPRAGKNRLAVGTSHSQLVSSVFYGPTSC